MNTGIIIETIEKQASDAILQTEIVVILGGIKYAVAAPTMRTLLKASQYCGELPIFADGIKGSPTEKVLSMAKDCNAIAPFIASLIIGSQKEYNPIMKIYKRYRMKRLINRINCDITPKELSDAMATLLPVMQPDFFLGIITFMTNVNLLSQQRQLD